MNAAVAAAVVAALAAVIGGLLTALSSRNVENMRVRADLIEKAEERKLSPLRRSCSPSMLEWTGLLT